MASKDLRESSLAERVDVERRIWDRVRAETRSDKSMLQSTRPTYAELFTAYPEYRYMYDFFGSSVSGKRVLDIGCGSGVSSVAFAMGGAMVTAIDISEQSLELTRERADFYGVGARVRTLQEAAEELDVPPESFDLFLGKSVVHHLMIDVAMPRLYKLLAPGGRGAIFEPRSNAVLDFARAHLPYPGKVADEHGTDEFFTEDTIRQILGHFDEGEWREFRLLGMLQRLVPRFGKGFEARRIQEMRTQRLRRILDPIDEGIFRALPSFRRLAQIVVLRVVKRG